MSNTESSSYYDNLEHMATREILQNINKEDQTVPEAVAKAIPQIEKLIEALYMKMQHGGRLFYIGAGTSGRLGILDASECPPTFGVEHHKVIGLIAGGDQAIRKAVEFAEDDEQQAWKDLMQYDISEHDFVIGIAASGKTPYVTGGLLSCRQNNIATGCITCNENTVLAQHADYPVEINTGPEFISGSTRMKSGTAQKLSLNMISTTVMIKLGRIKGSKMVDMEMSNRKLVKRGVNMLVNELDIDPEKAEKLLFQYGSVRNVLDNYNI